MIKNYFKIAIRNILKNKTYSFINIAGLGLGLATGFIVLLWVNNEYSMNKYHRNADRIYQVNAKLKSGNEETTWENTPAPVALFAKEHISDVEEVARIKVEYGRQQVIKYLEKNFIEDKIGYSENELFRIFDFPIIAGNRREPLAKGLSVVLPQSTAKRLFGSDDAIGKIIRFRDTTFVVSAVMKDLPANSSIQFDAIFSMDILRIKFRGNGNWKTIDEDWGNFNYSTFCLMKQGSGTDNASAAILGALKKFNSQSSIMKFPFRPLANLYLYKADGSKGRIIMVELFFIVAVFILLIASINYINLVTARATKRVKEIGIRKIVGAAKRQLTWQFFIETGVLLMLAVAVSFILVKFLLPLYQQVSGNEVNYDLSDWRIWKVLLSIIGAVWLLTGLYPALLLSSFRPIESLKGKIFLSSTGVIRKSLVVLQFVVSLTLILGTVFIHQQMNYVQRKDLHVNTDNVIVFPVWKMKDKANDFRNGLQQMSYVRDITSADMSMFDGANTTTDIDWEGKPKDEEMWIAQFNADKNFLHFFGTELEDGTGFENTSPGSANYILNETAVKKMGLQNPVGKTIKFHNNPGTVIGVVKDFHFESLHKEIGAALITYSPDETIFLYARVAQSDAQKVIAFAQDTWKDIEPVLPLEYSFLDDVKARQYDKDIRASRLFDAFSLITLFISCLGLFGLATYSAERRVKEVGIRKVLGAGVSQLATLLSKEFIVLVLIATAIAVPIVWIGMDRLLNYFAYRITLHWWVVALTCGTALLMAIITVSFQTIRAAVTNPVKSLRTE